MRKSALTALSCAALCLAGCFSLDKASMRDGDGEHVLARNYGWALFNCIPFICGNASADPSCGCVMFRNDVTMEKVQARLADYAAGREIECPVYHNADSIFITLFGFPIPYVICYKEVSVSATLKGGPAK
ncbi:MAG: hypothetical protein IKF72_14710 [Kiritimatiellae bacterium]|nr:hypothetical protein [Kiritimatiellia bacterium]